MKIQIREGKVEISENLRDHVERRLSFALGRFGERIGRVVVRFPHTGTHMDRRCRIEVGLSPKIVRVEDRDDDLFSAVDHAVRRVSRSVARTLEREREWDESPIGPRASAKT